MAGGAPLEVGNVGTVGGAGTLTVGGAGTLTVGGGGTLTVGTAGTLTVGTETPPVGRLDAVLAGAIA